MHERLRHNGKHFAQACQHHKCNSIEQMDEYLEQARPESGGGGNDGAASTNE